jgi:hypothetical protein
MTKTTHIQVRLSDEDKALIQQYAKDAGQSLSDYVRGAAMARVWQARGPNGLRPLHETTSPPEPRTFLNQRATASDAVPQKRSYAPDPR